MRVTLSFKTIGCYLMLFSLPSPPALAQQSPDTASFNRSTAFLQRYVRDELGPDSRLYNGYEYIRNGTPAKGFPFFDSDSLQMACLAYDGMLYPAVPMEYDLVLDKLVIRDYSGKSLISLISEKVDSFSFGPHRFRFVPGIENPGFYEVLFSSRTSAPAPAPIALLARREKKLILPSNREDQAKYEQHDSYFIQLGNQFHPVDGKNALLEILKDKKDALKKYISANKLRFNKQLESSLIRTTAYYSQLSH